MILYVMELNQHLGLIIYNVQFIYIKQLEDFERLKPRDKYWHRDN